MNNNVLKDKNGNIFNPKIPRYEKKNYIILSLNANQPISNGNNSVLFSEFEKVGDLFEFSNSKVKVLRDCVAILSANVFVDGGAGDGYLWSKILVNSKEISNNIEKISTYTQTSIPAKVVSLKENDLISVTSEYGSSSGIVSIRSSEAATFLSVVKI